MIRTFAVVLAAFSALSPVQAQTDWRFAHPDADLRLSVNLQALMKSPLVQQALRQAEQQAGPNGAQVQMILGLLASVDRIAVSARQAPGAAPNAKPDALELVSGSFDPKSILGFFPPGGITRVQPVGPRSILIGEGPAFTQAVERLGRPAGTRTPDEFEQSDIWISGGPGLMKSAGQAPPAFRSLRAFSLGLSLGAAPELNMVLQAADTAGATELLAGIHELMAKSIPAPQAAMLEQALQMVQDGPRVRFHFMTPPELIQAAQEQAASGSLPPQLQGLLGIFGMGGGASAAAPQPPANGGKIMIYGLDGGPREVQPQEHTPAVVTLPGK